MAVNKGLKTLAENTPDFSGASTQTLITAVVTADSTLNFASRVYYLIHKAEASADITNAQRDRSQRFIGRAEPPQHGKISLRSRATDHKYFKRKSGRTGPCGWQHRHFPRPPVHGTEFHLINSLTVWESLQTVSTKDWPDTSAH
jgi:hypothetical protein